MGKLTKTDTENLDREYERKTALESELRAIFEERYSEFLNEKEKEFDPSAPLASEAYREQWADYCECKLDDYTRVTFKEDMYKKWLDKQVLKAALRGKKIEDSARKGGDANTIEIRKKKGGNLLSERKEELESRLQEIMQRVGSKKCACEFLAKESDVCWAAEYLRKNLLK